MRKHNPKLLENKDTHRTHSINLLIKAADLAGMPIAKNLLFSEEPTRAEKLGLTIRTIRQKNRIDYQDLALKSRCSPETIIALEMGLLPLEEIGRNLPNILLGLGMDQSFIEELVLRFKTKEFGS